MGLAAEHGGRPAAARCSVSAASVLSHMQLGEPFHIGLFHFALMASSAYFQRIDIRTELFAPESRCSARIRSMSSRECSPE